MIEVNNLEIKYGDFTAIDNISFHVKQGEFFTFLGPSGCGKTTTLRAIAGFNSPSKGQIIVNDRDITHLAVEKREIGMVFQSYALFPTMTVFDNIAYGLKVDRKSKAEIQERVLELAQLVQLSENQLQKNISDLSGGQQQRVAIARALAKKPEIILFDEPLSNLDAKLRKQLRQELKRIQRETGMTTIYVTHDQEEALEMSDRIAVFNNGVIEQIGTPRDIYSNSQTEFVCNFIGEANYLGPKLIEDFNRLAGESRFDVAKRHYIRQEKVKFAQTSPRDVALDAAIVDEIFTGTFSTFRCHILDTDLKTVEKLDGNHVVGNKESIKLYMNPDDILEYEVS
ncbi:ABC transporter ATP-binding protein [Fundicoccus sp. Sow4_H7]|uniref:ABC transporter ATP-binding protein n=1 Tax=Fundicoccus sp. Sow4_H7 TaxID=3438784 RepID=UPI003F8FF379